MPLGGDVPEFKAGDRPSASALNRVAQAAFSQLTGEDVIVGPNGAFFRAPNTQKGKSFKNNSGSTIPAYGIIRIADRTAIGSAYVYDARQPNTYGSQYTHFINGSQDILDTKYGRLFEDDVIRVLYDSADGTPAFGERWGPRNGTFKLKKDTGGFYVLGEPDTTLHTVLVKREPMTTVRGKPTADVSPGGSATLDIYVGAFGSETQATGNPTLTSVRNDSSCTITGSQIATAQYVPDNGGWQFIVGKTA